MDEAAQKIVERFALSPHPEGGYFREVYRSSVTLAHPGVPPDQPSERRAGTLIYFLLAAPHFSAFHRVQWTDEIWHLYAGGPLELHIIDASGEHELRTLTGDLQSGEPTAVVPAGCWQAAKPASRTGWAFGGCTVAPGFEFSDFEMPSAEELIAAHPRHAALIRELTRR